MSQTVKIDEAAQAAIAEIVGMPWTKDYYDNTLDEDRDFLALVERSGASVRGRSIRRQVSVHHGA